MKDYLKDVEWGSTRSIYRKLSDQFHVLTNPYAIEVNERLKLMLDHLILGIDEVDQVIDVIPKKADRDSITESMLGFLKDGSSNWNHKLAPISLTRKMETLKRIVIELHTQERFCKAVEKIFRYTEEKRHTLDRNELIELVQLEGMATAELPLSILQVDPSHAFSGFFVKLCTLMGVADLIIDARSDYKSDYISTKPNLKMYLKLNWIMIKNGLSLIWGFPKKMSFLFYCIQFSFLLITSRD